MNDLPAELKAIINDKTSGSRDLLINLNGALSSIFNKIEDKEELFPALKKRFSEFPTIVNYLEQLQEFYSHNKSRMDDFFKNFENTKDLAINKIYRKLKPRIEGFKKFLTLSNSKTLTEIFTKHLAEGYDFEVIISESRPLREGVKMAELLAETGVKISLITEAMLAKYARECDAGIIGADKILPDGSIINKTGSLTLAVALRYYKKPLFVIADNTKRINQMNPEIKKYPEEEIYKGKIKVMQITNEYFEKVDEILITKLITD